MADIEFNSFVLPTSITDAIQAGDYEAAQGQITTYLDTLEEDQRKAAVNLFVQASGMPMLIPPAYMHLLSGIEEKNAEIISSMLDAWIENITEIAEQRRREVGSPNFQYWLSTQSSDFIAGIQRETVEETRQAILGTGAYQSWIATLPDAQRTYESSWTQNQNRTVQALEGVSSYASSNEAQLAGAVAIAALMIASAFIGNVPGAGPIDNIAALNPVQDVTNQLVGLVPINLQDTFLLAVNLFAVGAIYYAHTDAISSAEKQPETRNPEYVRAFAASMMALINSPQVGLLTEALLSHRPAGTEVTEEQAGQLTTMVQIALLSVALAALYKAQTDWVSGMDYAGMLMDGDPQTDEERVLQYTIKELLQQLPRDMRARVIEGLMAYMDTNPSIRELMRPSHAFQHAYEEVFNTHIQG